MAFGKYDEKEVSSQYLIEGLRKRRHTLHIVLRSVPKVPYFSVKISIGRPLPSVGSHFTSIIV